MADDPEDDDRTRTLTRSVQETLRERDASEEELERGRDELRDRVVRFLRQRDGRDAD